MSRSGIARLDSRLRFTHSSISELHTHSLFLSLSFSTSLSLFRPYNVAINIGLEGASCNRRESSRRSLSSRDLSSNETVSTSIFLSSLSFSSFFSLRGTFLVHFFSNTVLRTSAELLNATQLRYLSCLFLQDVAGGGVGGGGGKGVGATWPDTVKQSGAGGTLTPADRHGSVQVSLPAHLVLSLSLSFSLSFSRVIPSLNFLRLSFLFDSYFATSLIFFILADSLSSSLSLSHSLVLSLSIVGKTRDVKVFSIPPSLIPSFPVGIIKISRDILRACVSVCVYLYVYVNSFAPLITHWLTADRSLVSPHVTSSLSLFHCHNSSRLVYKTFSVYTRSKQFALFLDKAPLDYGQLEVCAIWLVAACCLFLCRLIDFFTLFPWPID